MVIEGSGALACCNLRGDVDGNPNGGLVNIADVTHLVAYLFEEVPELSCPEEANIDGMIADGSMTDISDLSYLVAYLFSGGPPPPPCP